MVRKKGKKSTSKKKITKNTKTKQTRVKKTKKKQNKVQLLADARRRDDLNAKKKNKTKRIIKNKINEKKVKEIKKLIKENVKAASSPQKQESFVSEFEQVIEKQSETKPTQPNKKEKSNEKTKGFWEKRRIKKEQKRKEKARMKIEKKRRKKQKKKLKEARKKSKCEERLKLIENKGNSVNTLLDTIYEDLENQTTLKIRKIQSQYCLTKDESIAIAGVFEEADIAEIHYPIFGSPKLILRPKGEMNENN